MGSIFASPWPAFTASPTLALTAVNVPLVTKPTDAVLDALTFPEAVTLDWTIPRPTVAVRCTPVLADELLLKKP